MGKILISLLSTSLLNSFNFKQKILNQTIFGFILLAAQINFHPLESQILQPLFIPIRMICT